LSHCHLRPGDRVLFRDGDRFGVARVQLVQDRYVTAFPFDPLRRSWARVNRRIGRDFLLGKLHHNITTETLVREIEILRNQRDARRQQANSWLEQAVRELAREREKA